MKRLNKIALFAASAFALTVFASVSCAKDNSVENGNQKKPTEVAPPLEVASDPVLNTQSAVLLGAPNFEDLYYKASGLPTPTGEIRPAQIVLRESDLFRAEDGSVRVVFTMSEALGLPAEEYRLTDEGVVFARVSGSDAVVEGVYLPNDLEEGDEWTYTMSFAQGPETMTIESTATFVGRQEVTTELGTFEAWVVEDSGVLNGPNVDATSNSTYYFVEGVGIVKMITRVSGALGTEGEKNEFEMIVEATTAPEE